MYTKSENQALYSATIGFIIGDALGVPVEFQTRDEFSQNPVTDMREFGTHNQPKGSWSDDTSMMLCTMEVLSLSQHFDNLIFGKLMDSFLAWRDEGYMTPHGKCFDIGIATNEALNRLKNGTSPLKCGGDGEYDNGNGSLMRILPLAFYTLDMSSQEEFELVHNISALTHNHIRSKIACSFYVQMVQLILDGVAKDEALAQTIKIITEFYKNENELSHFNRILDGNIANLTENEISSSGYVVHTLEAVLWCFMNADNFKDSVLKAVNLGDDTDTIGALVGGIAGVYYGREQMPMEWINSLVKLAEIEEIYEGFEGCVMKLHNLTLIDEYEREHGKVFDFSVIEYSGEVRIKKYYDAPDREHLVIPDFVSGVYGKGVFHGIRYLKSIELGKGMWDLDDMFRGCDMKEVDLSSWDVSNVISMSDMFADSLIENIGDIGSWDVSNVTCMWGMFSKSKLKSIGDIGSWNVSNALYMQFMFYESSLENIGDIGSWDVSNVKDMGYMFLDSRLKDIGDLGAWDVSEVEKMSCMFKDSKLTYIGDISKWNTSKVKWMIRMFENVHLSDIGNIGLWDVSNVWEIQNMFGVTDTEERTYLKNIGDLSSWNVSKVENMCEMFEGSHIENIGDISSWDVSNVWYMEGVFKNSKIQDIGDISAWNISEVRTMVDMFKGSKLKNVFEANKKD